MRGKELDLVLVHRPRIGRHKNDPARLKRPERRNQRLRRRNRGNPRDARDMCSQIAADLRFDRCRGRAMEPDHVGLGSSQQLRCASKLVGLSEQRVAGSCRVWAFGATCTDMPVGQYGGRVGLADRIPARNSAGRCADAFRNVVLELFPSLGTEPASTPRRSGIFPTPAGTSIGSGGRGRKRRCDLRSWTQPLSCNPALAERRIRS